MRFDAILIPGGGVRDAGELPPWSQARFDLALELQPTGPFVCLSAATTHRPPPLANGFPIAESIGGARYLMARGVDPAHIRIENASVDTIGNAYLTKLIHVDPASWRKLLVITSEFHMPRTQAIFEWIYGLGPVPYELTFEASLNRGMSPSESRAREQKEAESLALVRRHQQRIRSLRHLHEWFFTEHRAYSAQGGWLEDRVVDARILQSY